MGTPVPLQEADFEIHRAEPVYEEPVAAPVVETETVAEQTSELRLEDLIPEQDPIAAAENTAQGMDFNTVNMGMPEAGAAPLPDGEDSGEISFEGLEELFGEDK